MDALQTVERLADELGIANRLHLWPDKSLGNVGAVSRREYPNEFTKWLKRCWERVSEWPKVPHRALIQVAQIIRSSILLILSYG